MSNSQTTSVENAKSRRQFLTEAVLTAIGAASVPSEAFAQQWRENSRVISPHHGQVPYA